MKGHNRRRTVRELLGMNRTKRKGIRFNPGGIGNGEHFGEEERATTTEDGIQIDNIKNVHLLDCGCIGTPDEVAALCDVCGSRAACAKCLVTCSECGQRGCRYCVIPSSEGGRIGLCNDCRSKQEMCERIQKVSGGIFSFFVKKEG